MTSDPDTLLTLNSSDTTVKGKGFISPKLWSTM
jgi:hypothetical protein